MFFFPVLLISDSGDGAYCRMDNVDIEYLRGSHLDIESGYATCAFMMMRGRQYRREDVRETTAKGGELCADLLGRLSMTCNGSENLFVSSRRETRFGFVKALSNQRCETIKDTMIDM